MQSVFKTSSLVQAKETNNSFSNGETVASNILDIIKFQQENLPLILDNSEKFAKAKEKLLKQLPNMYKNTRLQKFMIQNNPIASKVEYKKIKGLMLNIEKRMSWYLNVEETELKCLLISSAAKTSKEDLVHDDRSKHFFEYYGKLIINDVSERKFITIPLLDLNIIVV